MIKENSGKIYQFKLDHGFGYGFAETYDFSDESDFDGRLIYVYNQIEANEVSDLTIEKIIESGIALGPIRVVSLPSNRGRYASKYI